MQLPPGSRVMRENNSEYAWTDTEYLLAAIENNLAFHIWAKDLDPKKRPSDPPEPRKPRNKADIRKKQKAEELEKEARKGKVDGQQIKTMTPEELKKELGY